MFMRLVLVPIRIKSITPGEVEFFSDDDEFICTLQDIYFQMARKAQASNELDRRWNHSFDKPAFIKHLEVSPRQKFVAISSRVTLPGN
jgi:hypothetical protein